MAQDFRNNLQRNVGTSEVTLVTGGDYDAVIGIRCCNVTTSTIEVDVFIDNSGNDHFIAKGVVVPPNSAIELIQGGAKIVLENNDLLRANKIGIIYQQDNLLSDFTALENVYLSSLAAGNKKENAEIKAKEILNWEAKITLEELVSEMIDYDQKLVEEGPWLSDEKRAEIGNLVCRGAESVGYKGLATFEFLRDANGDFYFLEVNPRVQVEHTVTELITGYNLVELGIRVAQGEDPVSYTHLTLPTNREV